MTKVILMPEPHRWYKSFENRHNYPGEINSYMLTIIEQIREYRQQGYTVHLIVMGDMYHMGYTDSFDLLQEQNFLKMLSDAVEGNLYSVIGNHEINFYRVNPFWIYCDNHSKFYEGMKSIAGYKLGLPLINIVDELVIDRTLFIFGHYGRKEFEYDWTLYDEVILLSHSSMMDAEVNNMISQVFHVDLAMEYLDPSSIREQNTLPHTDKLKYVYVGHMHLARGTYRVTEEINGLDYEFTLHYMESLGRTNIKEIDDTNLMRKIPVHTITSVGNKVDNFTITLEKRINIVKESVVAENKEKYLHTKELRTLRNTNRFADNPVDQIKATLSQVPHQLLLFEQLMSGEIITDMETLLQESRKLI